MRMAYSVAACALCASLAVAAPVQAAEAYPTRPIRLIVPFPPGGSNDIVARLIGQHLGTRVGETVVVDNRPGAGSTLGIALAANSEPDGYTLVIVSAAISFGPSLYKKLPYDQVKSFIPVSKLGSGPNAFTVNPSVPVKSMQDMIALAKAKPGTLNFASAGIGSAQHLWFELFKMLTSVNIVHIPFKGGAPAMIDVIAGNSHVAIGTVVQMLPHIRSGKLKGLATGGTKRSPVVPDLPTLDEAGVKGYEGSNWWGIMVPARTPKAIVDRLDKELGAILALDEVKKQFSTMGAEVDYQSQGAFARHVAAETVKWSKVAKQAGIRAQ
ncbi:MAG: tripartite tricarboxylate transporter substrate binding protein [Betaproteobacteria bacterium]|nr:MAG: tripartite tricarboxylate transporter substrate binding protein [Betaproteobacteria bacterium]